MKFSIVALTAILGLAAAAPSNNVPSSEEARLIIDELIEVVRTSGIASTDGKLAKRSDYDNCYNTCVRSTTGCGIGCWGYCGIACNRSADADEA